MFWYSIWKYLMGLYWFLISLQLVYYHYGGLRLNPNLYESGKVCLNIWNTWKRKGNEVWNQTSSNVLQILVSIQGLVLNVKPYFNEPGYENKNGLVEGENNSGNLWKYLPVFKREVSYNIINSVFVVIFTPDFNVVY